MIQYQYSIHFLFASLVLKESEEVDRGDLRVGLQRVRTGAGERLGKPSAADSLKRGHQPGACSVRRNWYRSLPIPTDPYTVRESSVKAP